MSWQEIVQYSVRQMSARGLSIAEMMTLGRAASYSEGTLAGYGWGSVGAMAAGAIPVAWQAYVFVTLGAPYEEARELLKNYNLGLIGGFVAGGAVPKDQRHSVVSALRKAAGYPSKGNWTRNDQISFVIPLAAAFSKRLMK